MKDAQFYGELNEGVFTAAQIISKTLNNAEGDRRKIIQILNPHTGYWGYYTCVVRVNDLDEVLDTVDAEGATNLSEAKEQFSQIEETCKNNGFEGHLVTEDIFETLSFPFKGTSVAKAASLIDSQWFSNFINEETFEWCNEISSNSAVIAEKNVSRAFSQGKKAHEVRIKAERLEAENIKKEKAAMEARYACGGAKWATW